MGKIVGYYAMPHPPIIIPEIGKGQEKKISRTFDACMKIAENVRLTAPHTIIVITPHGPVFRDAVALSLAPSIYGNLSDFNAGSVEFNCKMDVALTKAIIELSNNEEIPVAAITENSKEHYNIDFELDHGTMIPLYFINSKYTNYKLVHITYGFLSKPQLYKFGMLLRDAVKNADENAVIIASGDLSHKLKPDGPYGFDPAGPKFDNEIMEHLTNGDILSVFSIDKKMADAAGECALRSYYVLMGAMDGCRISGNVLSYEGPFGVGYGVMSFTAETAENKVSLLKKLQKIKESETKLLRKNESPLVRLARMSLEHFVKYGEYIDMPSFINEDMLNTINGVFVSIKKDGELRGCIGTVFPRTNSLPEEIIRNAVEAGENDPRFYPVEEEELDDLIYSVDVIMPPEAAAKEDLDPKNYGVIVRDKKRSGLLLPDLEGVNTVDEQLSIALNKAGIRPDDPFSIERFKVIRYM